MNVVLLAAGISNRYGDSNKLLEPYLDTTIIERVISQLLTLRLSELVIVLGHDAHSLQQILSKYDVHTIVNTAYKTGMVSSVKAGLESFDNEHPYMLCLGDMPKLISNDYNDLIAYFYANTSPTEAILRPCSIEGQLGNPVLFSADLKPQFLDHKNLDHFKDLFKELNHSFYITNNRGFFTDVDTKEDYFNLTKSQGI